MLAPRSGGGVHGAARRDRGGEGRRPPVVAAVARASSQARGVLGAEGCLVRRRAGRGRRASSAATAPASRTLLKILSRITEPTDGPHRRCDGRVASLLEVGTGFHPELTGRENIFLNGAILGMTRAEITRKFDEIVAFAEVEKFLDTPVKRYSSGMYVRLAFAVAAHLEPEILIVDEVLAVGDAAVPEEVPRQDAATSRRGGRTVLFVSHNMPAIGQLCQRAISLGGGKVLADRTYRFRDRSVPEGRRSSSRARSDEAIDALPADPAFRLEQIALIKQGDNTVTDHRRERPAALEIDVHYEVLQKATGLRIYVDVCDDTESLLFRTFHDERRGWNPGDGAGLVCLTGRDPCESSRPTRYILRVNAGIHNERHCSPGTASSLPIDVGRRALQPRLSRRYVSRQARPDDGLEHDERKARLACGQTLIDLSFPTMRVTSSALAIFVPSSRYAV